jgi:hypothetical protein
MSASAIGLCHYLLSYFEGSHARPVGGAGNPYVWDVVFFGSLPGATAVLYQNITQSSTATNGLEFAALFNERDGATPGQDDLAAFMALTNAAGLVTSWPARGGGQIQWSTAATNVNKTAGHVTVALVRSGAGTLPVKVSYTTYALTAGSSDYTSTSGVVNLAAGVTSQAVTVPLLSGASFSPVRQFSLELLSASGGAWLGPQLSSLVSILDTNPPPPSPPQFVGSPILGLDGSLELQFLGSPGQVSTLQTSADLLAWQTVQTFTNSSTGNTFTDTVQGRPKRFYRLVVP